jgi:integrase
MPRTPTGSVVEKPTRRGTAYALRFRAYGKREYLTLGYADDGWTAQRADQELQNVLADVRRGIWRPAAPLPEPEIVEDPTFHQFASDQHEARRRELAPQTVASREAALTNHLLPFFAGHRLSQITAREVDRYREAMLAESERRAAAVSATLERRRIAVEAGASVREAIKAEPMPPRPLSPSSINKTLKLLAQLLDDAIEYGLIDGRNPARGRRRRLKAAKPRPVHLDSADQIVALLDAARELDARSDSKTTGRYALIGTLVFAGPRCDEAGHAAIRDLDLARGWLEVGKSKTDAGLGRRIELLPVLRDILGGHKAGLRGDLNDPLFPTAAGTRRDKDNIRNRVLAPVVKRADELLADRGQHPLPRGLSPHKLRHTFASVLVAIGKDPAYVMQALGHTDPAFTLRVYAHVMRFSDDDRARLKALVEGQDWAPSGTSEATSTTEADHESIA